MALNALAIDLMLPALPQIGEAFRVAADNDRQLVVVVVYLLGFGIAQLVHGPLCDAYGRRTMMLGSVLGFAAATALCLMASDYPMMLAARALQGVAAAGLRVASVAIVRDLYAGRRMAEIMSVVMTVFLVAPIAAPAIGQAILLFAPWPALFLALFIGAAGLFGWTQQRLSETLAPGSRRPLSVRTALEAYALVLRERLSLGYMAASGVVFGALFAFIVSSEQILVGLYDLGPAFPLAFAAAAGAMSAATLLNARLVRRLGMRRISHSALIGFTLVSAGHALHAAMTPEPLVVFLPLICLAMLLFGMLGANFNAIAMEPLGRIAGSAAALYGFATTTGGAVIGGLIGRAYGTVLPLLEGQALIGCVALAIVIATERGRLFEVGARALAPAE